MNPKVEEATYHILLESQLGIWARSHSRVIVPPEASSTKPTKAPRWFPRQMVPLTVQSTITQASYLGSSLGIVIMAVGRYLSIEVLERACAILPIILNKSIKTAQTKKDRH